MTRGSHSLRSPEVAAVGARGGVALQPIGATEQHGPHLPVTTDAVIAGALAQGAADRLPAAIPVWVLPTLAYGKSPEHAGRPGTVTLRSTTFLALCLDVASSVVASGFQTMVFVNAHGGNPDLLRTAVRDIRGDLGLDAYTVDVAALTLSAGLTDRMPRPDVDAHAGFYETSVMLALAPQDVALDLAAPDGLVAADEIGELRRVSLFGGISLPWHTDDLSDSGTIGDPRGADPDWGRAALAEQVTVLAEAIGELVALSRHRSRR